MATAAPPIRTIMFGYYASSCCWRVRAALYAKKVPVEERAVDIIKEKHHYTEEYRAVNPSQKVPALVIDGITFGESMAIIQYLDETRPEPPLMPSDSIARAKTREICESVGRDPKLLFFTAVAKKCNFASLHSLKTTVVSGIQPLQNIGLKAHFGSEKDFTEFAQFWTTRGLQSLEDLLSKTAGRCCVGDQITMADICLVPQIYSAIARYDTKPGINRSGNTVKLDGSARSRLLKLKQTWRDMIIKDYPTINSVYVNMLKEDLFHNTHPKVVRKSYVQLNNMS